MSYDAEATAVQRALAPVPKLQQAYDADRREFWPDKVDHGLSTGEGLLLDTATALWKGEGLVDVGLAANYLDDDWFEAFVGAMVARRGRPLPAFDTTGQVAR